jgi:hypothetical protein
MTATGSVAPGADTATWATDPVAAVDLGDQRVAPVDDTRDENGGLDDEQA